MEVAIGIAKNWLVPSQFGEFIGQDPDFQDVPPLSHSQAQPSTKSVNSIDNVDITKSRQVASAMAVMHSHSLLKALLQQVIDAADELLQILLISFSV